MYRSTSSFSSDILTTIEGVDIYNSYYIAELDKISPVSIKVSPTLTNRLDLLSKLANFSNYKSTSGTLGVINRFTKIEKISDLKYIDQSTLNSIVGY